MTYEANRPVKTTVKTFEIIEQLSRTDRIRLSRLADELDVSKGIIHNHLSTLRELGYVRKVGEQYQLSAKLLSVGFRTRSHSQLFAAAHPPLTEVADRVDTGVVLCEQAASDCIVIDAQQLPAGVDTTVGTTIPLSESLLGQVVDSRAATASESAELSNTYDPAAIDEAIDERGYAIGPITSETAVDCIAVPICEETGDCYGSLGVMLPSGAGEQRSQQCIEAALQLRTRTERRLGSGWEATRSFATEKHSWIT